MKNPDRLYLLAILCLLGVALTAQSQKIAGDWTEWTKKDAEKLLTSSPWAQTQVETDLTEMFYTPTSPLAGAPNSAARGREGATNQEIAVSYHIRFFSARPIRQALARLYQLQQKPNEQELKGLHEFASLVPSKVIIVAVTYESTDKRAMGKVMQAFNSAITGSLRTKAYLERKDGARVFLEEYAPPGKDGFGARFIFPRFFHERPFVSEDSGEIRFYAEFADKIKLNMRFPVKQMKYNDQLEY